MMNYEHLANDLVYLMGKTPKERYETLLKLHSTIGAYKGRVDYLLSNIKAIAESPAMDDTFKTLLNIVHEVGSKQIED
jgi:hypothetical protein